MRKKESLTKDLARIVGSAHVRDNRTAVLPYNRDATPMLDGSADAVVFPADTSEVARIAEYATRNSVALIPRGAGTNLAGGTVPVGGGVVMALSRLDRILDIDPSEQVVSAQPSVTTADLDRAVSAYGLMYPPDPGSRTVSTIGGNIATNAGGLRGLKYGVTGDYVRALTAVLPTGEVIRTGTSLKKDVAGYDLKSLLVGSEGTLAIITEATLAVVTRPECELMGVAYFDRLEEASATVADMVAVGIRPSTLEFLDSTCIRVIEQSNQLGLDTDAGALLLFGDDGTRQSAAETVRQMAEIAETNRARSITTARGITEAEDLRAARRCTLPALAREAPVTVLEDIGVPRSRLPEMVQQVYQIAEENGLRVAVFGHAGDGNLHPTLLVDPSDGNTVERADRATGEMFEAAIGMGGTITGEHGIGVSKLPYLEEQIGSVPMRLIQQIKSVFDPAGILNPGKLVP